jgi:arginine exporter protein ArgO
VKGIKISESESKGLPCLKTNTPITLKKTWREEEMKNYKKNLKRGIEIPNSILKEINKLNLNVIKKKHSLSSVTFKTLGFTFLNPHVYSDTVFFLGNFSKGFALKQKMLFGFGASISSILFFFIIGYASKYLSNYLKTEKIWKIINLIIIIFMSFLTFYVFVNVINFFNSSL